MRAHLLLLGSETSWALDAAVETVIGASPLAAVRPPGVNALIAARMCFGGGEWTVQECAAHVRVTRRNRALDLQTALVDGDTLEIDGVRLLLEIEDEDRDLTAPVFLLMPNGFAHQLAPGDAARIGDGPDFDLRVRLGLEGSGCKIAFDEAGGGGNWTVEPVGATPLWIVRGAERTSVIGRARLTNGCGIDIDEAVTVEFVDLSVQPDVRPSRADGVRAEPRRDAPLTVAGAVADDDTDAHELAGQLGAGRARKLVIEELPRGAFLWTDHGSVGVDVSEHDVALIHDDGAVDRFGATRAGLQAVLRKVLATLRPRPLTDELGAEMREAVLAALRRVAGDDAQLVNEAEVHVADIEPTPLVLARGVLHQKFLLQDATRFLPCAVAIASIENDVVTDADTPERAEVWADRLSRWRELYLAPGSSARSVNRALTDYGDDVHARTLWGLRKVRVAAPIRSLPHMQLLCAIGAHPYTRDLVVDPVIHELVVSAGASEIGEALVILDEGGIAAIRNNVETPSEVLAGLLLTTPGEAVENVFRRKPRLADVFAVALQNLEAPLATETLRPPIPLPRVRGLRFLSTVGELTDEGRAMSHCAALYGPRAVAGESYLFHYHDERDSATIEVATDGVVLQSRGPGNTKNAASRNAERILTRWGRALRLTRVGDLGHTLWTPGALTLSPARAAFEPLITLGDLVNAYRTYVTDTDDVFDLIIDWCVSAARDAMKGNCWLVKGRGGPEDHLLCLDASGERVGSSAHALTQTLELGRGPGVRGP